MADNFLDAMKAKLQKLESGNQRSAHIWKPEAGSTTIRIVPYQFRKNDPFLELWFHYNVGKGGKLSLKTFGEEDPIVEFALKLQATAPDKEAWKIGKKMEPQMRVFVPIIIRGKEAEGVKFWGFGKEIFAELLKYMSDPDYGDMSDLNTGRDIIVEYKTPAEAKNTYGKVSCRPKANATKATTDKVIADLILHKQKDIYELYEKPTYEELSAVLQAWMEPGSGASNTNANTNDKPKASAKDDIFGELIEKNDDGVESRIMEDFEANAAVFDSTNEIDDQIDQLFKDDNLFGEN